jgi:hypothetical protein
VFVDGFNQVDGQLVPAVRVSDPHGNLFDTVADDMAADLAEWPASVVEAAHLDGPCFLGFLNAYVTLLATGGKRARNGSRCPR